MSSTKTNLSLVADFGGTNTRVGLAQADRLLSDSVIRYRNAEFTGVCDVLKTYIAQQGTPGLHGSCIAVAGPVSDQGASLTNLDWHIDARTLAEATGVAHVAILNDLQAQGLSLSRLSDDDLQFVRKGRPADKHASKLVIGVGTGFNIAPTYHMSDDQWLVTASEAGHIALPVASATDLRLSQYIADRFGFADVEEVLSGRGVGTLYAYHAADVGLDPKVSTAQVFEALKAGDDPIADRAAQSFVHALARVTSDLALIQLPFGGIFFIGGVARGFGPYLERHGFFDVFAEKGRFSALLEDIPIAIIENDFAALTGCATYFSQK